MQNCKPTNVQYWLQLMQGEIEFSSYRRRACVPHSRTGERIRWLGRWLCARELSASTTRSRMHRHWPAAFHDLTPNHVAPPPWQVLQGRANDRKGTWFLSCLIILRPPTL